MYLYHLANQLILIPTETLRKGIVVGCTHVCSYRVILDIEQYVIPCVIYSCCNLVTSNITTVISNNNRPIGECFHVSWYTKQTSDLFKARIKSIPTRMSRRRSLHSELKVLMANIMASNIADGFIR